MGLEQRKTDPETAFHEVLGDVLVILQKLGETCNDLAEVTELVALAVGDETRQPNAGQLRILMAIVHAQPAGGGGQKTKWTRPPTSS